MAQRITHEAVLGGVVDLEQTMPSCHGLLYAAVIQHTVLQMGISFVHHVDCADGVLHASCV